MRSRTEILVDLINSNQFTTLAEVGVGNGVNVIPILAHCPTIETFYLIDRHLDKLDFDALEPYQGRIVGIERESWEAAKQIKPYSLDLAFIDTQTKYEAISQELKTWLGKLKAGGIIAGPRYSTATDLEMRRSNGVREAVRYHFGKVHTEPDAYDNGDYNVWWKRIGA